MALEETLLDNGFRPKVEDNTRPEYHLLRFQELHLQYHPRKHESVHIRDLVRLFEQNIIYYKSLVELSNGTN